MTRTAPSKRSDYRAFVSLTPRWNDIDVFGHVNNAAFFAWFDTAVLNDLHRIGAVEARDGRFATLVVESSARFHSEVLLSDEVTIGLSVRHLGRTSVGYGLGVLRNDALSASVDGGFTHVFADRQTRICRSPDATTRADSRFNPC